MPHEFRVLLEVISIAVSNEEGKSECVPGLRNEGESGEDESIGDWEVEGFFVGMDAEGAVEVFEDQGDEFVWKVKGRHYLGERRRVEEREGGSVGRRDEP